MTVAKPYQPTDTMSLWWLGQPEAPRLGSIEESITQNFSGARVNDQWMRLVKPGAWFSANVRWCARHGLDPR